jgi:phospholipid/cholesterol/gamma-HCH transport system permease protein
MPRAGGFRGLVQHVGAVTLSFGHEAALMLSFFGRICTALGRTLVQPWRLRATALVRQMELTGIDALPIVGLLSFLIGIVLAFQGADQLRRFGAEIFTVNLLGVSVLRELGVLLTAIIVAGRSGSAFTAEIGAMQVNQEIDALETIGLDPVEVLVLPRLLALVVTLPLLAFFASIMALVGGGLMVVLALDIPLALFVRQLAGSVRAATLWAGMVKAPVFAFLIAMVGCYEGMRVTGSAESVGRLTTTSVVVSIFLVILVDALFSILFAQLGV